METLKISKNDIVFNTYDELDTEKSKLPWISHDNKGNLHVDVILLSKYISSAVYEEDGQSMVEYLQVKDDQGFVTYYIYDSKRGLWRMVDDELFKGYIYKYIPAEIRNNRLKSELWSEITQSTNWDRICKFDDFNTNIDDYINFQDGFLNIKTKELIPHTPKIKSTIQIPCKYKEVLESNGYAPTFDKYMEDLCYEKPDYRRLLLEFMGAIASNIPGKLFKKILIMKGLGDTGKSKLRSITEFLIGPQNSTAVQFSDLSEKYEIGYLYGKRLAGHGEASDKRATNMNEFKALTGGDQVSSSRKYKGKIDFTFNGFFWYNSNFYIKFDGDAGKWVYDRLIIMEFNNVIPEEKRDKQLEQKLKLEKNGIMYQVLQHLYMLIDNNLNFHLNADLPRLIQECKEENSPILQFIENCFDKIDKTSKEKTLRSAIYSKYREWCTANNNSPKNKQNFFKELEQSASDEDGGFFCNIHGTWYIRKYKFNEDKFKNEINDGKITNKLLKDIEIYEMENGPEKAAEKVIIDLEEEKLKQKEKQQQAVANNINNITGQDKEYDDYFMKVGNSDEHIKKIEDELNKLELPFKSK